MFPSLPLLSCFIEGPISNLICRVAFIYSIAGCTRGTHPQTNCAVIRSHQPCLARARCNRGAMSHAQNERGCAQSLGPLRGRSLRKIEKHNYVPSGAAHIRKLRRDRWIRQEAPAHTASVPSLGCHTFDWKLSPRGEGARKSLVGHSNFGRNRPQTPNPLSLLSSCLHFFVLDTYMLFSILCIGWAQI